MEGTKSYPLFIIHYHISNFKSCNLQAARKSLHPHIGPGPSKFLRPIQELESRVLLHDLIKYSTGNGSTGKIACAGSDHEIAEDHWFSSVRRYVSTSMQGDLSLRHESNVW